MEIIQRYDPMNPNFGHLNVMLWIAPIETLTACFFVVTHKHETVVANRSNSLITSTYTKKGYTANPKLALCYVCYHEPIEMSRSQKRGSPSKSSTHPTRKLKILSEIYKDGGLSKSCEGHDSCKFPTNCPFLLLLLK